MIGGVGNFARVDDDMLDDGWMNGWMYGWMYGWMEGKDPIEHGRLHATRMCGSFQHAGQTFHD
jgi:hypothetical protein